MGRVLGPALRAARATPTASPSTSSPRSDRRPRRGGGRARPGLRVSILRPPSADELIDEEAFDEEEFLPYWAELWPSGVALARVVAALDLRGWQVLELGCGPRAAVARGSAPRRRRARDRLGRGRGRAAPAQRRAQRHLACASHGFAGTSPEPLLRAAPWDLVLGADLLYEERNAEQLLAAAASSAARSLLAEPGRPFAKEFLERWRGRGRSPTASTGSGYREPVVASPSPSALLGAAEAAHRLEADPVRRRAEGGDGAYAERTTGSTRASCTRR